MTFTAFCRTDTGKLFVGIEDKNSLKSSLTYASGEVKFLTMFSIDNIQDAAK